jgi:hypothetical protein
MVSRRWVTNPTLAPTRAAAAVTSKSVSADEVNDEDKRAITSLLMFLFVVLVHRAEANVLNCSCGCCVTPRKCRADKDERADAIEDRRTNLGIVILPNAAQLLGCNRIICQKNTTEINEHSTSKFGFDFVIQNQEEEEEMMLIID